MAADAAPRHPHGGGPGQRRGGGGPQDAEAAAASGGAGRAERTDVRGDPASSERFRRASQQRSSLDFYLTAATFPASFSGCTKATFKISVISVNPPYYQCTFITLFILFNSIYETDIYGTVWMRQSCMHFDRWCLITHKTTSTTGRR